MTKLNQLPTITKRVTVPIASDGVSTNAIGGGTVVDYNTRSLVQLPVDTTRWRLRVASTSALSGTVLTGIWNCTGVWVGTPLYSATGLPWQRAFASTPSQALSSFSTVGDGTEFVSSWVTGSALQFKKGVPTGISYGLNATAPITLLYSSRGATYGSTVAGNASSAAGNAAIPSGSGVGLNNLVVLDIRIEYEFATTVQGGVAVGAFIGDSITSGWSSDTSTPGATPPVLSGAEPHQTWPGAAGMRNGFAWINMGVGSTTAAQWSSGSGWRWARCDLTTNIADFGVISLCTNDVVANATESNMETNIQSCVAVLRSLGINEIYLGTMIARGLSGAQETARADVNNWMRNMPCGIAGVFDFDKATYLQATPTVLEPDFLGSQSYPHPNRAGYQQMSTVVRRSRIQ